MAFLEYFDKMAKINIGTSSKKETVPVYVRNLFMSNKIKLGHIKSLAGDYYRAVRHQERDEIWHDFRKYLNINCKRIHTYSILILHQLGAVKDEQVTVLFDENYFLEGRKTLLQRLLD